jgi:hypothetical protein
MMEITQWLIENWLRPVLILCCGMLLFNLPTLIYKIWLTIEAILYLLFCNDKSWKKPQDPASIFNPVISSGGDVQKKTIYFVRHGESTWNDTFNKGSHRSALVFAIGFIPGMIKAILYELYLVLSGKIDRYERLHRYDRMRRTRLTPPYTVGFTMLHFHNSDYPKWTSWQSS